jgi:CheY-like chemotaxis protein
VSLPEHIRRDLVRAADELLEEAQSLQHAAHIAREEAIRLRTTFADRAAARQSPVENGSRPILVVDDDPTSRKLLRVTLETEGYVVRAVGDAELALLTVREVVPQLIVTDLYLPGMSGLTLIRRLQAEPSMRGIPIIVVTVADFDDELTRHALDAGAAVCYVKPIRPATFVRLVRAVVAAGGRPEQPSSGC